MTTNHRKDLNTPRIHSQSKKIILEPNEIILESKNIRTVHQSEQLIERKYTDLLIDFFETHQPSYIFEPIRKEYYWTDEPFDEDKITRLEKLLHNTSYFVQNIFWYLRIILAVCITIPIEIIHTILAGLIKPIFIRLPMIISDTLIKPFYSGLFNALILPIGIVLWNTSELLAKILEPFIRLFEPCMTCFRSIRRSSFKQFDNGDGYQHTELKKSTLCV